MQRQTRALSSLVAPCGAGGVKVSSSGIHNQYLHINLANERKQGARLPRHVAEERDIYADTAALMLYQRHLGSHIDLSQPGGR